MGESSTAAPFPGSYHETNRRWFEIITHCTQIDLTPLFQCPFNEIYEEVTSPEFTKRLVPTRSVEELEHIKDLNVGKAVGGEGTPYQDTHGWNGVALYNRDGNSKHLIVQGLLTSNDGAEYTQTLKNLQRHQWTDAVHLTPKLHAWLQTHLVPHFYLSFVRILVLQPGGMIPPHDDIPEEVRHLNPPGKICSYNNLNSFAISLNEPDGSKFYHDGRLLNHKPGSMKWINTGREHWVVNMSKTPRYHLQWQGMYKRRFRDLIVKNINKLDAYPQPLPFST